MTRKKDPLRKQVLLVDYKDLDFFKLSQILRLLYLTRLDLDYRNKKMLKIPELNKKSLIVKRLKLAYKSIDRELKDTEQYIPEKYKWTLTHYYT